MKTKATYTKPQCMVFSYGDDHKRVELLAGKTIKVDSILIKDGCRYPVFKEV